MLLLWIRELLGWLLMTLGLYFFWVSYGYLDERQVVEAFIATISGIFIFRAGIHFMKVAVAARILLEHNRTRKDTQSSRA